MPRLNELADVNGDEQTPCSLLQSCVNFNYESQEFQLMRLVMKDANLLNIVCQSYLIPEKVTRALTLASLDSGEYLGCLILEYAFKSELVPMNIWVMRRVS